MGRAAAASGQRDPFAVNEDATLAALEKACADGGYHGFSADGGTWCAITSAGEVLTGATPDELNRAVRAHWQAMLRVDTRGGRYDGGAAGTAQPAGAAAGHAARSGRAER